MHTFAQILNGVVLNIILANVDDIFDPAYIWVDLTLLNPNPMPQVGWGYDGQVFSHLGLPLDAYGYTVTIVSGGGNTTYTNSIGISCTLPSNAPVAEAYLLLAIQTNLLNTMAAAENFVQCRYSDSTRLNLIGLVLNAQLINLTDRLAYLAPLLTWQNSIIAYLAGYIAKVESQVSDKAVVALTPDLDQFIATDPLLSPLHAIQIKT